MTKILTQSVITWLIDGNQVKIAEPFLCTRTSQKTTVLQHDILYFDVCMRRTAHFVG